MSAAMKLLQSLPHTDWLTSVYSAKQVLENEAKVAQSQNLAMYHLMELAGQAAFNHLISCWPSTKHVLVLAGKGNNGGDGFIVASLAKKAGMKVTVLLTCIPEELKGDAAKAYQAMLGAGDITVINLLDASSSLTALIHNEADIIVDALFGIGFRGSLPENIAQLVAEVNVSLTPVLSIDVPSGLCATTGAVSGSQSATQAIMADVTVTFIVLKSGLLTGQAANFVGQLKLSGLGLGDAFSVQVATSVYWQRLQSNDENSTAPLMAKRLNTSHKGSIGMLLAVGGNTGMPGAIRLASEAALRCGASLVSVCCHEDNQALVFNGRPELMMSASDVDSLVQSDILTKVKAIVLGPGLGHNEWAEQLYRYVVTQESNYAIPLVIDADGLSLLAKENQLTDDFEKLILTPHPKEAARLLACDTADIEANRIESAKKIAQKYQGICVLKGAGTVITDGKRIVINSSGNAGMASGGMGDVLSGIIAALCMQTDDTFYAVCLSVYIHGCAADILAKKTGPRGMLASDLFIELQKLVNH